MVIIAFIWYALVLGVICMAGSLFLKSKNVSKKAIIIANIYWILFASWTSGAAQTIYRLLREGN